MGAIRRSRAERAEAAKPIRVQDRDIWILEALAKMRFLNTSQLARLAFDGSIWAAQKRLRKLLDRRLVRVWVENLADENVYSLDRAGRALLADGKTEPPSGSSPRRLDGTLEHLLAINDVRIALALELAKSGAEIQWWRSDWELRSRAQGPIVPDALFAIAWPDGNESTLALELDNRAKAPKGFLAKILGYQSRPAGVLDAESGLTVLAVSRDEKTMERYRLGLARTGLGEGVWFASLEEVKRSALGPIWRSPFGEEQVSLRHLSGGPCCKEGSIAEKGSSHEDLVTRRHAHISVMKDSKE